MFDPKMLLDYIVDGRYRLASVAGTGSYGWVFAADEIAFGQVIGQAAVQLLRVPDDAAREGVIREVTAMRRLTRIMPPTPGQPQRLSGRSFPRSARRDRAPASSAASRAGSDR